jgi:hypothetical protein
VRCITAGTEAAEPHSTRPPKVRQYNAQWRVVMEVDVKLIDDVRQLLSRRCQRCFTTLRFATNNQVGGGRAPAIVSRSTRCAVMNVVPARQLN